MFDDEYAVIDGVKNGEVKPGNVVVVIRYCGPKGGPGMPEMLKTDFSDHGRGIRQFGSINYRWQIFRGTHGFVVGHITPEAL